ncbi:1-phosphofructokinase family hexose kinase [Chitinophaga filiformis]|uniref:1-phosphofructokinase family hexose kinase n=1 Tax=Chitinophaga filiformis TaxID=104663 RepID=UPI001F20E916|nr:1-phosphofructokinase family hexose kinase [Chitinophaga filiformis]MCF6405342.1 1-phosphofructokinase family hexose kinase [Chitinophaga filiformis]
MILTITMNPALDKSTTVEKMFPEKKLRCEQPVTEAGGGGINASKAIKKLGGESVALYPAGGANGARLRELLTAADIKSIVVPLKAETRENITVTELSHNQQFRFVMPGPALDEADLQRCLAAVEAVQPVPNIVVASGSLPPGVPNDFLARLAHLCKRTGSKLIVDTSGEPLLQAARKGIYLLKPNMSELCSLAGKEYLELDEVTEEARKIIDKGYCEVLVISMGPAGALLVTRELSERISAPAVKKRTAVGAGDSMVGGMAWMLDKGEPLQAVARFGVACGTAATMNTGTQLFKKEDVYRLYEWINR